MATSSRNHRSWVTTASVGGPDGPVRKPASQVTASMSRWFVGLVEQEHVAWVDERPGQGEPATLTAGQVRDPRVQTVGVALGRHPSEQPVEDRPDPRISGPLVVRSVPHSHVAHGPGPDGQLIGLPDHDHTSRAGADHPTRVRLDHACQHPEQGRLAIAVAPDHAHTLAPLDAEGDPSQDRTRGEHDVHALEGDDGGHGSKASVVRLKPGVGRRGAGPTSTGSARERGTGLDNRCRILAEPRPVDHRRAR